MPDNAPHRALRHHVTGAIERGEAEAIAEQRDDHPFSYELTTGEDVLTFYYPSADGSIESLRRAAQGAADAEQQRIELYVMPREGDEWVFDTYYEPRTIND